VMMLSGIMSLDWEAPQMARTVVAIPAIYAIASIPLGKVWAAWDSVAAAVHDAKKRRAAQAIIGAVVLAAAGLLLYLNVDRYFNLQANSKEVYYSFSTIETVVARRVAELGPTANRYYIQTQGTPAFSFLVGGDSKDRPVDAVFYRGYEHMPLRESITKTAVYLLEPWRVTLDPAHVLHYYPNATFVDHTDPFGTSILYEFRLQPDDVNGLLGLTGRYFAGVAWQGAPILERTDRQIDFDWTGASDSPAQARSVEWSGSLVPPVAGTYALEVVADGSVRMSIDDQILDMGVGRPPVRLDLAKGQHPLVMQFSGKRVTFYWTPPGGQRQVVPTSALIAKSLPANGLLGRYYRGDNWQGRPEFVQVDPYLAFRWHPDPIEGGTWSAEWNGQLEAPKAGRYLFQLVSNDRSWLSIDGKALITGTPGMKEVETDLAAGMHSITVKYANAKGYSELRLSWRRPDNVFEVIPNRYLYVK
jgi:hypothetical protein